MSHQGQRQLWCVCLGIHNLGGRDRPETPYGYGRVIGVIAGRVHKFAQSCLEVDWGMMRHDVFNAEASHTVICKVVIL
jgi:hypothetical protein